MFKIYGGATEFQQWSLDQKVINDCMDVGEEVVFRTAHGKIATSLARMDGDVVIADVPNEILKYAGNISVELGQGKERCEDCYTVFAVIAQDKPEGYVCTDNRNLAKKYLLTVKQELTEAEKEQVRENIGAGSGGGASSWNDLTDKPFGTEVTTIKEILAEGELTFVEGAAELDISLFSGNEDNLAVAFDGTEYICEANTTAGFPCYGNLAMMGLGEDTGEPFAIVINLGEGVAGIVSQAGGTHIVSIREVEVVVSKIDADYVFTNFYVNVDTNDIYLYKNKELTEKATTEDVETFVMMDGVCTINSVMAGVTFMHHAPIVVNRDDLHLASAVTIVNSFGADGAPEFRKLYVDEYTPS